MIVHEGALSKAVKGYATLKLANKLHQADSGFFDNKIGPITIPNYNINQNRYNSLVTGNGSVKDVAMIAATSAARRAGEIYVSNKIVNAAEAFIRDPRGSIERGKMLLNKIQDKTTKLYNVMRYGTSDRRSTIQKIIDYLKRLASRIMEAIRNAGSRVKNMFSKQDSSTSIAPSKK